MRKRSFVTYLREIFVLFPLILVILFSSLPTSAAPQLVSPTNGSTISDNTPTLDWNGIKGATGYHIQVDDNSDCSSPFVDDDTLDASTTEYTTSVLSDGTYYWRVYDIQRTGSWSAIWSFTVSTTLPTFPLVPGLVSPTDGATVTDDTPTFNWNTPRFANSFHLQVADIGDFSSLVIDATTSSGEYTTITSLSEDTYYWRVRAKNDTTSWGSWSTEWSLTVSTTFPAFPLIPSLVFPTNGATVTDDTPTLNWNTPRFANSFHLQVADIGDFSSLVIDTTPSSGEYTPITSLSEDTYYWRVRAKNDTTSWGSWSEVWSFTISTQLEGIKSFLQYSTFVGGSESEWGKSCSFDSEGNLWVLGTTYSNNFPTTPNAEYPVYGGGDSDCYILKFASNRSLLYSTYIGGSGIDQSYELKIDSEGNIWITGLTWSSNFPITADAYDSTFDSEDSNIQPDAFITKLASNGTIVYSTFIGGSTFDYGFALAIDDNDNAWITGSTQSSNIYGIPTTNAYDPTWNGGNDVFVVCIAANGSKLLYGTYIGSSATERGQWIGCYNDSVWISGYSNSLNFPTTPNADDDSYNGNEDAFIAKINITTGDLVYSSFIGGSGDEQAKLFTFDSQGNVYITGYTNSDDFPTTTDAFDSTYGGNGKYDGFIIKLWNNGTIQYSSYIGTSEHDTGSGISLQEDGTVWLSGTTNSSSFPTTFEAVDQTHNGERDIILMQFSNDLNELLYSSILGGTGNDFVYSAEFDSENNLWFVGGAESSNFPTTPDAFNTTYSGNRDAIILSLAFPSIPTPPENLSATLDDNNHVNLTWDPPTDDGHSAISSYRIYRSPTSGVYGSHLFEVSNLILTFIDDTIVGGGVYYYTITALNLISESIYSNEVNVRVLVPFSEVPTLDFPSDEATIDHSTPYLGWAMLQGATSYHVQVATDESFLSLIINETTEYNHFEFETDLNDGKFYWRVRASNETSYWSSWSMIYSFLLDTTSPPLHEISIPTIIFPNGGTFKGKIEIEWTEAIDSLGHEVTYDIYYSLDNVTWVAIVLDLSDGTDTYDWDITTMSAGSSYLINVVVICSEDNSVFSEDFSDNTFTIQETIISTGSFTSIYSESNTITTTTSESGSFSGFLTVLLFIGTTVILRKYKKN